VVGAATAKINKNLVPTSVFSVFETCGDLFDNDTQFWATYKRNNRRYCLHIIILLIFIDIIYFILYIHGYMTPRRVDPVNWFDHVCVSVLCIHTQTHTHDDNDILAECACVSQTI